MLRLLPLLCFLFVLGCLVLRQKPSFAGDYKTTIEVGKKEEPRTIEWSSDSDSEDSSELDPKQRAFDFEEAFKILRKQNPGANTFFIVEGISINHVVGFEVMSNGTLVLLTVETSRGGVETRVVKAEDITEIGQR